MKAKKPSRSIQYRLLADRKLRRLSLRKVTERLKKAKKPSRSIRARITAATAPTRFAWSTNSQAIVLAMICVAVAAALVTARQAPSRAEVAEIEAWPPPAVDLSNDVPEQRETKKPVIAKATATTPMKAAAESAPQVDHLETEGVTMTGCLEHEDETFRLASVSGADAPRSRSWKSGFLRKRPAKVELVDATNTLRLPSHVGRRVAATGTLIDGEMHVQSLRLVASSCRL